MSDSLKALKDMAEQQLAAAARVRELTAQLEAATAALNEIARNFMPEAMREAGVEELVLVSGERFKLESKIQCGISEANKEAAHNWLRENGYGGLIKIEAAAALSPEDVGKLLPLQALCEEEGLALAVKEAVNASTLKAFIRERLSAGESLPEKLFGLYPYAEVTITKPKAKKDSAR